MNDAELISNFLIFLMGFAMGFGIRSYIAGVEKWKEINKK